ncbi:hypothetical protein GCM10025857_25430 [Alicyclobacillus contaminans]|nr:hypothetical protein GCM10025857_25430 [Alicyclobacillus contaminans]
MLWHAASPQRVATQVLSWLNRASLFLGDIPASDRSIVLQGNIGPAQLRMVTVNHQTMTLCPTSYLVQVSAHQVQIRYVQDVVTCVSGDQTVYLKAPQLFHWLKDGDWEGEFTQAHS